MPTKIEWCQNPDGTPGEVWNPVTGCTKVSQGCKNCYAERIANRFWKDRKFTDVICHEDRLEIPLRWNKPRRVFVNSMSDLFHPAVPFEFIKRAFQVMTQAEQHTFMVLTKRPERMMEFFKWDGFGGDNPYLWPGWIWLGVSVEDQKAADSRIPLLLQSPARVNFISAEPLLGKVDLVQYIGFLPTQILAKLRGIPTIDWVICGGESGPNARPMHPDWVRSIRDQCQQAAVPFFFKQWGEWMPQDGSAGKIERLGRGSVGVVFPKPGMSQLNPGWVPVHKAGKSHTGHLLDGKEWREFPT